MCRIRVQFRVGPSESVGLSFPGVQGLEEWGSGFSL